MSTPREPRDLAPVRPVQVTGITPGPGYGQLEPYPGAVPEPRIVEYRKYAGGLVPVYEHPAPVQPTPPRDLSPQPLLDSQAQRLVGKGVFAAGVGVGAYFAAGAFAIVLDSLVQILIAGGVAAWAALALPGRRRGRGGDTYITNHNRWFGRSHTSVRHD